jgi:hypothetical protein
MLRWPMRLMVLRRGIPRGLRIPATVRDELTPPRGAEGSVELARLERAIGMFEACGSDPPRHPVLGELTRDEWREFHLRHCELHLGHLVQAGSRAASA